MEAPNEASKGHFIAEEVIEDMPAVELNVYKYDSAGSEDETDDDDEDVQ